MTQGIFSLRDVKTKQIENVNNNTFLYWPEEPLYGYVAGGQMPTGPTINQQVYKIDYSTEVVNTSLARTTGSIYGDATITNAQYGYFGGNNSTYISRLDYASESFSLSSGGSTSPTVYYAETYESAVYSKNYGYFGGGTYGIKKFDMSTEVFSGAGGLNGIRYNSAVQSSENGYFTGGMNPTPAQQSLIYKLDFSVEQISTLSNSFSTQFIYINGGASSSDFGYIAGGHQTPGGTTYSFINRLDFSTELSSNPGKNLSYNVFYNSGCDNSTYGYFIGGLNPVISPNVINTISRIDFSTEVVSNPGKNLPSLSWATASQSGGASVNPNFTAYGYFVGGPGTPLSSNNISRIDFNTESVNQSTDSLPVGLDKSSGVYSDNIGYVIGGNFGPTPNQGTTAIYRVDLVSGYVSATSPMGPTGTGGGRFDQVATQSSLYGYFVGGNNSPLNPDPGYFCSVYRLDLSNDTVSVPGRQVFRRLSSAASAASNNYGYFSGGGLSPGAPPTPFNYITRIDFNTDVVSEPGQNLPLGRTRQSGTQSSTHAYFAGGAQGGPQPATSTIFKLDFSNETVTLSPKTLPSPASGSTSVQSENYGYFGGSYSQTTDIYRIEFSNDTISSLGYKLTVPKSQATGLSAKYVGGGPYAPYSSTYGYFVTNYVNTLPYAISDFFRLDLTTEVVSQPTSTITPARYSAAGTQSNTFGYIMGGEQNPNNPVGSSNKLEFSTETVTTTTSLVNGRSEAATVQNATYGWIAGGRGSAPIPIFCTIVRLQFSNDTATLPGQNLQSTRYSFDGVQNNTYGFFMGGLPGINTITRLDLSTEVISDPGKNLPATAATWNQSIIESNTHGYIVGGNIAPSTRSSAISKLDFSNETVSLSPKTLPATNSSTSSIKSANYAYFGGGYSTLNCAVTRLEFSTDTAILQLKSLPRDSRDSAGIYD